MGILDKYYRDGGLMSAEDFRDQAVPGATAGVDPVTLQPYVDQQNVAAMERVAQSVSDDTRNTQIATQEMTDEQKAAEEERKKQIELEKSKLKEQQAILDRADKEAGLGMRPEPEVGIVDYDNKFTPKKEFNEGPTTDEEMVFTEEEAGVLGSGTDMVPPEERVDYQPPSGMGLVTQGYDRMKTGTAGVGGAKAAEIMADAEIDQAMGKAREADLAADDALQLKRLEIENVRKEIDSQILAEMERDIKPPSPSALSLLGVFLNGLIAPMQGGRNTALDIVQKQMQREVDIEMENKRKRISLLNRRRGIVADEEMGIQKQQAASDLKLAKKYKAFRMQLESALKTPTLTAQQRANTQALIGQIEVEEGKYQLKAAQDIFNAQLKMRAQVAKENAKKKGGGGTGGGKSKGLVKAASESPLYFDIADGATYDISQMKKDDQDKFRKELAVLPIIDTRDGSTLRGVRGFDSTQAKEVRKVFADRNKVRLGTQRILKLLKATDDVDRFAIGGATRSKNGARLKSEFTNLMVALKDKWELGAIQKPDMVLMEGAMGMDPSKAWAFISSQLSMNQIEAVIGNLQDRGALEMKTELLSAAGLPEYMKIQMPRFDATSDIDERETEQKPVTNDELQGNIEAGLQALADDDEGYTYKNLDKDLTVVEKRFRAGTVAPSEIGEAQGIVAKGNEKMWLKDLKKRFAGDNKAVARIDRALKNLSKKPSKKTLLEQAKRMADKKKKKQKSVIDLGRQVLGK